MLYAGVMTKAPKAPKAPQTTARVRPDAKPSDDLSVLWAVRCGAAFRIALDALDDAQLLRVREVLGLDRLDTDDEGQGEGATWKTN